MFAASSSAAAEQLAYLAQDQGWWQARVLDLSTNRSRQLTRSPGDKTRVSWYPDGRALLVATADGHAIRVDLEGREDVVPLAQECPGAVVSPSGDAVACSRPNGRVPYENDIWVAGLDGSPGRRLTRLPGMQHQPAWQPHGDWLYFASGSGGATHDIWRVSRDGRRREQLTAGARYQLDVAVSPAGDLAFSSNRSGDYEIWVRRADGSAAQVTRHPGLDSGPSWSPDGARLAFERVPPGQGQPQVWLVDLADLTARQVTHQAGGARCPAWAPALGSAR
jgi:Tol biopolymer transport system component